ncbi:hypothetical protein [Pyrobaculum aerophilum]|uniref:Uncharacterized protein n=1 Tax=Pyrobaculum aerophilum TaxID=13773 RepID=A0A832WFF8_9CREN|nr:hypothetical protein [Pyrobaculum aerophilum]HII47936.1 hypothetical protein [Pyrobaculum aerophilum]
MTVAEAQHAHEAVSAPSLFKAAYNERHLSGTALIQNRRRHTAQLLS